MPTPFLNPGQLIDKELELKLTKKVPGDPITGYIPMYEFAMINTDTGEKMGEIRLRIGFNENIKYGGHIGYDVDKKFRGNRYAARSVQLLFPLAKKHKLTPLWITCNPDNIASKKTCEIAGGKLIETVDLPEHNDQYQRGERQKCRYRFDI